MKKFFKNFYLLLIFLFLYAPIVVLMIFSFNDSKSRRLWNGFTTRWYVELFRDADILHSLYVTLLVAVAAAAIATVLGTIAAIGIHNMGRRAKAAYLTVNNIPMSSSDTIMGVTFMLLFAAIGLDKGYLTLILAHVTFCTPYVVLNVMPKLRQLDKNAYEAALDLGATQGHPAGDHAGHRHGRYHGVHHVDRRFCSLLLYRRHDQSAAVSRYLLHDAPPHDTEDQRHLDHSVSDRAGAAYRHQYAPVPRRETPRSRPPERSDAAVKKRMLSLLLCGAMCTGLLSGCGNASSAEVLNVYNWGEYIDTDLIDQFEEETGIKVIYNTFDSNENLYSRIQTTSYDVIIPSDYAISRFIDEDMLQPLNYDHIPNMKLIDEKYTHLDFDPEQKYSVPYTWGVVGIVYNTKYVDKADIGSWDLLWNPKYTNRTAMFNNSRDALGIALMYLGCSLNTTDKAELRQAADLIIAGKPVYQGIWMDQILEKLPSEEIVAAPYYDGDAVTMIDENPDLAFYVPKEGTNLFVDAMCIPKNAKNVSGAEKFINFMCSTEAAMANWEYIGYSSPQAEVYNELDEEITSDPLYFPDITQYPTEAYTNLPTEINQYYNDLWVDILT